MTDSYHTKIQEVARAIEKSRSKRYTEESPILFTPREELALAGMNYKIRRLMNGEKSRKKALDDVIDVYNFAAILFVEMSK